MEQLKIAVCEDDPADREQLCGMIRSGSISASITVFERGEDFLPACQLDGFDLIFMDIYLKGLSGVETVRKIRELDGDVPVAFTTASLDYALDSYRLDVAKYMEKPVSRKAVNEMLALALHKKAERDRVVLTLDGRNPLRVPVLRLRMELSGQMGFSLFFSIVLLTLGLLLFLMALVLTRFEAAGATFFWLGLFCVCVAGRVSGECNLTGVLIVALVFLYLLAFIGPFTLAIPLLKFGRTVLGLQRRGRRLLDWACLALKACTGAAILLQLSGTAAFSRTMYLFHILVPLALCIFAGVLVWESAWRQNPMARRFLFPTAALALFTLLEVGNYYLFRLSVQKSFFFQRGLGLQVIASLAEKHGGGSRFEVNGGVFYSSVYLPICGCDECSRQRQAIRRYIPGARSQRVSRKTAGNFERFHKSL